MSLSLNQTFEHGWGVVSLAPIPHLLMFDITFVQDQLLKIMTKKMSDLYIVGMIITNVLMYILI